MTARALLRPLVLARDLLLALLALPFVLPLRFLPWNASCALGSLYGLAAWVFLGKERRAGLLNLRRAYGPSMSRSEAGRQVRKVFANLGRSLAEGIRFSSFSSRSDRSWESLYEAEDPALEARILADPRPKVFVTGHLGSWEVAMQMLDLRLGGRGVAVARRVDNPFVDALARRVRRGGGGIIEKALAARRAGLETVLLPRANEKDLTELPEDLRESLEFVPVDNMEQVLERSLERPVGVRAAAVPARGAGEAPADAPALGVDEAAPATPEADPSGYAH